MPRRRAARVAAVTVAVAALGIATTAAPNRTAAASTALDADCPRPPSPPPERVAGPDRVATALAVAAGRPGPVARAVLAPADRFPDATVGAALAGAVGAPLLLTGPDRLAPAVAAFLRAAGPVPVAVVGGPAAVAPAVVDALEAAGHPVTRLAGTDRHATSRLAAELAASLAPASAGGPLVVASGASWADAAVGSALASGRNGRLVLTDGDDATPLQGLAAGREVVLVGGVAAVTEAAATHLATVARSVDRLAGADRILTAVQVAHARPGAGALLVTGANWPDAVVAAAAAAAGGDVVLLTGPDRLPAETAMELAGRRLRVVGGEAAVPGSIAAEAVDVALAGPGAGPLFWDPAPCGTTTIRAGATASLAVSTLGSLQGVDLTHDGPATVALAPFATGVAVHVTGTAPGTVRVALSATAVSAAGVARPVRVGWTVAVLPEIRAPEGWLVAPGTTAVAGTAGPLTRYTIEIADGLEAAQDVTAFAAFADQVLQDPVQGWTARGAHRLQRVDDPAAARVRVVLATPATVDRLCARAGLDTGGVVSCWTGRFAALNWDRWSGGVAHVPDLTLYRTYLVNHEVGHGLGNRHRACPGPGQLAPVMMQLTLSTYGCRPNGWPYPVAQ